MTVWHTAKPDEERIKHTAQTLRATTRSLQHEHEAITNAQLFPGDSMEQLFHLLARAEVINLRLHKQLVDWHTIYPDKPSREETDRFWAELKELRAAKEKIGAGLTAIREYEKNLNTLSNQLDRAGTNVEDIERYFEGYLDRVNRG